MKTIADLRNVPIPQLMSHLPIEPRSGLPLPFFAASPEKGGAAVATMNAVMACCHKKVCWICGKKLLPFCCFISGPIGLSNQVATDGPCHPACAEYAVRACPYMAIPGFKATASDRFETHKSPGATEIKPECFAIAYVNKWRFQADERGVVFFYHRPVRVAWFAAGEPTDDHPDVEPEQEPCP